MQTGSWMILAPAAVCILSGCAELQPADSKARANQQWNAVRAELKCQMAAESFSRGQIDEARTQLEESLRLDPAQAGSYLLMTRILLEKGQIAAAQAALTQAIDQGGPTAETHYLHGLIAQHYRRFEEALTWYTRASESDPTHAHYVSAVAEMLVATDRVSEALTLVNAHWTDFEHSATLRALAGDIYMMLGQYEEASNAYREAVLIAPDDLVMRSQLGYALTEAGHYQEAKNVLTRVVDAQDKPSIISRLALGRCLFAMREYATAKDVLRTVIDTTPDDALSQCLFAQAALACGDLIGARRSAGRACEIDSDNSEAHMLLAYICHRQHDYDEAIRNLGRVLDQHPQDTVALCLLRQCNEATHKPEAARQCYMQVLDIDPDNAWAQHLLNRDGAPSETRQQDTIRETG